MKFVWANEKKLDNANVVLFGVADESGSHASRKGASLGPDRIRKVSNERLVFTRKGIKSVALPQLYQKELKIHDYGNIKKEKVTNLVQNLLSKNKFPIAIGGDHSITYDILKGYNNVKEKISVIYFDAHPDFVCSSRNYYGSVVCDILDLKYVNLKSSIEIGARAIEKEELINIKKRKMKVITPDDITERGRGVKKIFSEIKSIVKGKVYLSIDMDVIDPAFAPGVDTPVPGGLSSSEILYLVRRIEELGLVGLDIMETSPPNDIQDMTSHLAVQIIMNVLSGAGLR